MRYYPIYLDIDKQPVIVIGGGEIAFRKIEVLLDAGARVTVISPNLYPDLAKLVDQKEVQHISRTYQPGDLTGYRICFVGTDDTSVNNVVAQEGRDLRVLVNAVDDTKNCDFIMPSVVRQGDLTIAISTAGVSPAAARKIREEFEEKITEDYALLLEVAGDVRQDLRKQQVAIDTEIWNAALDDHFRSLLIANRTKEAKEYLMSNLLNNGGCDLKEPNESEGCSRCSYLMVMN